MIATFSFPTSVRFGPGAIRQLPEVLAECAIARPLVVTDATIAGLPIHTTLRQLVGEGGETYSDFAGNPLARHVAAGVAAFAAHRADGIVALGGGAALDVAKAIALMAHHPGALFDYEDGKPDARPVDQHVPPIVALPTTAGTGSEVGRSTVISDDDTHAKKIMFSPKLMPAVVIADPELLLGLPAAVSAATGMDALTHNVEAFLAKGYHPMCDAIALEGVRLVARSLARSVADGSDVVARGDMLMASMMGAVAFQKGLGATHSLAHALSTVVDTHHGLANGILLPFVMRYNAEAVPQRITRLAAAAGLDAPGPDSFVRWLETLKATIGIPAGLSEIGVTAEQLPRLADVAAADACHPFNPRACSRQDLLDIYRQAL